MPVRTKTCDPTGTICTCLRLALLGSLESAATQKDTKPFIDWLNGNSGGSAVVKMIDVKPTIDAAFLANYDILLVANVNTWAFTAEEKEAVATWVKVQGGGIVTLTGFASTAAEVVATSQLVDFAGMGYTGTNPAAPPAGDWAVPGDKVMPMPPLTYRNGPANVRDCLNFYPAIDRDAALTTPIAFTPQTGSLEKLTASLYQVGGYIGWPVKAPAGATVVATDPVSGKPIAVAYEVDGKGRIFSFGDEWVILANQWQPSGAYAGGNMQMDASNVCWLPPSGTEAGTFHSARTVYQTKQFWYNAINWVAPPSECNFTIEDPDVVVVK
ncbi:MAG: hypothetical protein EOO73_18540 [Myxococcales bacterium]|nr:MAG: hypothetical protein EOO73_18540 [Myxococcales bacterium]